MKSGSGERLPVHGFVLAGGKSTRMGRDKATLHFRGRPMIALQIEKLTALCEHVSIAGNREDLQKYAPVVAEARLNAGPVAGVEAGIRAAQADWALFVPVDVPLWPVPLVRRWAEAVLEKTAQGTCLSYLRTAGEGQPAFCLLHRRCAQPLTRAVERGERRLAGVYASVAQEMGPKCLWVAEAETFAGGADAEPLRSWFSNINTPAEHSALENAVQGGQIDPE